MDEAVVAGQDDESAAAAEQPEENLSPLRRPGSGWGVIQNC